MVRKRSREWGSEAVIRGNSVTFSITSAELRLMFRFLKEKGDGIEGKTWRRYKIKFRKNKGRTGGPCKTRKRKSREEFYLQGSG